jgi:hydrogenase/urease accessory protein HupE
MRLASRSWIAAITLLLLAPLIAYAHEVRPGYLEITEQEKGTYKVLWKAPSRSGMVFKIEPVLPDECQDQVVASQNQLPGSLVKRQVVNCGSDGLAGKTISINGLSATITDVLVRVLNAKGQSQTVLLKPHSSSFQVLGAQPWTKLAMSYLSLGIKHILMGVDHLLFVLGLLLIVHNRWMLIKTITSFTVAHSITLGIATLGYASAPVPPLNAAIALSILFLGPEIVRSWRGETSFTIRHPWVVAFAFGLLHGFGFASGLNTIGLPRAEIPVALLLFNVGVEFGQIAFVVLILLLERSFRILEILWPRWVKMAPGYAVGSLGAYWFIQRTVVLIGGLR